jgi:RHS repeat-associated protein
MYCQNNNYNVVALTDSTGAVVERVSYTAYGQPTCTRVSDGHTQTASHFDNPWLFQGQRYCPESGLYNFKYRDYSAPLGRLVQWDLIGYTDAFNLYEAFLSSPLRESDPLGLQPDTTSPRGLGWEWVTGTGPREHHFGGDDPFAQELRRAKNIMKAQQEADEKIRRQCSVCDQSDIQGDCSYSLQGFRGIQNFLEDYSAIATQGRTGNLARAFLGSFSCKYKVRSIDCCQGMAVMEFHVKNESTLGSALRPPVIGYWGIYNNYVGAGLNWIAEHGPGPMSKTVQTVDWEQQVGFDRYSCPSKSQ